MVYGTLALTLALTLAPTLPLALARSPQQLALRLTPARYPQRP